jgi:hypothetical protein
MFTLQKKHKIACHRIEKSAITLIFYPFTFTLPVPRLDIHPHTLMDHGMQNCHTRTGNERTGCRK